MKPSSRIRRAANARSAARTLVGAARALVVLVLVVALVDVRTYAAEPAHRAVVERIEWELADMGARVIAVVKGKVNYTTHTAGADPRLKLPPRAYVDLSPAHLGREISRAPIAVDDRLVRRIRIAQFDARTVRIVVDLTEPALMQVSSAERPSRLILTLVPTRAPPARRPDRAAVPPPPGDVAAAAREAPRLRTPPPGSVATLPREAPPPTPKVALATPRPTPSPRPTAPPTPLPTASASPRPSTSGRRYTIVLDPGHGGKDPGARGVTGEPEKSVTLAIVREIAERLKDEPDVRVLLTREDDRAVPLEQRTAIANAQGADLFLSIHANGSGNRAVRGIETYTLNNTEDQATIRLAALENGLTIAGAASNERDLAYILSDLLQTGKEDESQELAQAVQEELVGYLRGRWGNVTDLGVKKGPFYVLVGAYMPCVLVEVGFLTNEEEGHRIGSQRYQRDLAEGIARGIRRFISTPREDANL